MPKKKPPAKRGYRMPPAYAAMIGTPRTCRECNETKPIDLRTFAPSKKQPDYVSLVCRSCQGRAASLKKSDMKAEGIVQVPEFLPDWPDPVKNRKRYWAKVEDLTDRLYSLGNQPHKRRALDEVCTELNKVTRRSEEHTSELQPLMRISY